MRYLTLYVLAGVLGACATTAPPPADIEYSESDRGRKLVCDAEPVQTYDGQMIKAETGEQILRESGSALLRWGPPDSAWTMDYRADRVNVRYDRAMTITAITCG